MKKAMMILLISMLLVLPLVSAQTYSDFNRFIDNAKMFFASGDNKVKLALEIREKVIDLAISHSQNKNEKEAIKNIKEAHKKLQFVRDKISLNVADEVKKSVDGIVNKIENEENLSDNFDVYVLEEKKTRLTVELTEETFELCKELAKKDYSLMLREEQCNPDTAIPGLEKELKELKNLQEESFVKLMSDIRSCMDDPGTCNCKDISDTSEKAKCEKMIALAVRCEYKDEQEACSQIDSMRPPAESFVPGFLRDLFKKKESMIEEGIEKSDVPSECYDENNKSECEQYKPLKEIPAKCWDAEGNWLEEECGESREKEPTMQESIPECYDENGNFLEEKCGKVIMVKNKEGIINYIIEKEIENILNEFENDSEDVAEEPDNTIDIPDNVIENEQPTIDVNGKLEQNKVNDIKEKIKGVEEDIQGWVTEHPVEDGESDDTLNWEIETEIAEEGEGNGEEALTSEVETDVNEGKSEGKNNAVEEEGEMASGTTNNEQEGMEKEDNAGDSSHDIVNEVSGSS